MLTDRQVAIVTSALAFYADARDSQDRLEDLQVFDADCTEEVTDSEVEELREIILSLSDSDTDDDDLGSDPDLETEIDRLLHGEELDDAEDQEDDN